MQAPQDIDARAAQLAIQVVDGHLEGATGSHMHWLMRELSRQMHRDFALSVREEALAKAEHNFNRKSSFSRHQGAGSGFKRGRGGRGIQNSTAEKTKDGDTDDI